MKLAEAAFAAGDSGHAEHVCRRILAVDCENEAALSLLVCVLSRAGRQGEALVLTSAVLEHCRRAQDGNTQVHALLQLQRRGFAPRGMLDVGAYHGSFTMVARQLFPGTSVLMVEPQPDKQDYLREIADRLGGDCEVRECLLGDSTRRSCEFHQLATPVGSTGSSIYPEISEHPRRVLTLPMRTLDELVAELPGRRFELLKIDVQGAELDVLRGARRTLEQVQVLVIELSLHEVNRGGTRLAPVVADLAALGFEVYDVLTLPRVDGRMLQIDAVFVRSDSPLWSAS